MMQTMDTYQRECRAAEQHLRKADPVIGRLIKRHGPCRIGESGHTLFHSLASAIISQQLSVKAADTIQGRVMRGLTAIKGIGAWTAEMYLMFGLQRLDIVSLGDAGLQRAARQLYNNGEPQDHLLSRISESWKPYRTIACWYLWKSDD